ncbi:MAG: hypothetical protein HYX84_07710 [Chloroflexi bacterium]|nr:hypothetical protein [Chloroflexota bacterium]
MRIYNKYLLTLALVMGAANSLLAFLGNNDLTNYFVVNIIICLGITLLFVHLNPRARTALNGINAVLFGGFAVIIALKIVEFLSGK